MYIKIDIVDGLYIVEANTVVTNANIYDRYITKAKFGEQHKTVKEFCDEYWKEIKKEIKSAI